MKQTVRLLSLTALVLMGFTTSAWAIPLTFTLIGVDNSGLTAEVRFEYASTSATSATINIDITNTSLLSGGADPRLTAFAFNIPADVTGFSSFTGPTPSWDDFFNLDNINTPGPFGDFDAAGLTGTNFNGGDPNDGIPRSSTFSFEFVLAGSNLNSLNELSFLSLGSNDPAGPFFIARFQRTFDAVTGEDGEGSDVAVPSGEPMPIPEPSTLLMLGAGLVLIGGVGRFRQRKSSSKS